MSKISNCCVQRPKNRKTYSKNMYLLTRFFLRRSLLRLPPGGRTPDSRHVRQSKYTVLHEESDFQVKNKHVLDPEGKIKEKLHSNKYCLISFAYFFCFIGSWGELHIVYSSRSVHPLSGGGGGECFVLPTVATGESPRS